jgi:hypothetical protein
MLSTTINGHRPRAPAIAFGMGIDSVLSGLLRALIKKYADLA